MRGSLFVYINLPLPGQFSPIPQTTQPASAPALQPLRPRPEQESPMKFLLTVLAALLLGCASSQADPAYYFAANGSDSKPCTQTLPCLTIAKAQSLSYLPGDSINFRGGDTFTGCLSITPTNVPS